MCPKKPLLQKMGNKMGGEMIRIHLDNVDIVHTFFVFI